jgi:hypothetical protein
MFMPRAMWMPRRRLLWIVFMSASLGMASGIAGAYTALRPPAPRADAAVSVHGTIDAAFRDVATAETFSRPIAMPVRIDEVMSSSRPGVNCGEATWPYFDKDCLWGAPKKQRHARSPINAETPASLTTAAMTAGLQSAVTLPVATSAAKPVVTGSNAARPLALHRDTGRIPLGEKSVSLEAYGAYAAVPRAPIGTFR